MTKKLIILACVFVSGICSIEANAGIPVRWDTDKLFGTPTCTPLPSMDTAGIKAILIDGPDYKGEKTRFFAYYGLPEGASEKSKVPAMVLIHGGGGSAFWEWVKVWNERGYAAIAMDTTGKLPLRLTGDPLNKKYGNWALLPGGIQLDWGGYDRSFRAPEEQWPYCAVAEVIIAHSFIRSLPEVDAESTALTGNSWGGYLTLLTSAVDTRFKFAAPVYACGYYDECPVFKGKESREQQLRWFDLWDPAHYIPEIKIPIVWAAGTNDFAYWFAPLQKSFALVRAPLYRAVRYKMRHTDGHQEAGRPAEFYAFADHMFKGAHGLPQLGTTMIRNGKAYARFEDGGCEITKAEIFYTKDKEGKWPERGWTVEEIPFNAGSGKVSADIPQDAEIIFFNLTTADGLVASSAAIFNVSMYEAGR